MSNLFLNLVLAPDQQNTPNKGAAPSLAIQEEARAVSHFSLLHNQSVIAFELLFGLTHPKYFEGWYLTLGINSCTYF